MGLGVVVRPRLARFPHCAEQRLGRLRYRWSAVVRWDGQCVGRPGVVGSELSGRFGLTPRAADTASPWANRGGFKPKNFRQRCRLDKHAVPLTPSLGGEAVDKGRVLQVVNAGGAEGWEK